MSDEMGLKIFNKAKKAFNHEERKKAETRWGDLVKYLRPMHADTFGGEAQSVTAIGSFKAAAGQSKTPEIYDATGPQAANDLSAAFQSTLTNPASKWTKINFTTPELNEDEEAGLWADRVNNILHRTLHESNFYIEEGKGLMDYVVLGQMILMVESKNEDSLNFEGIRFKALHLANVAWQENEDSEIDKVYRKCTFTAEEAFERFGNKVSPNVMFALKEDPEKEFEFIHCTFKRDAKDVKLNSAGLAPGNKRPWASFYIQAETKEVVEEGGFYEFPFLIPRFSLAPGEIYGRGPGDMALPEAKSLNKLKEFDLKAKARNVNPPIAVTPRNFLQRTVQLKPGTVVPMRDINGLRELVPQTRQEMTVEAIQSLKESIRSIFFLDRLLLPPRTETGEMTAFEIARRIDEMQRVLGPTLTRLIFEFLQPLLLRVIRILERGQQLPPRPASLLQAEVGIDFVFINQLARAQNIEDVTNIQQVVQNVLLMAQFDPEVVDTVDTDTVIRHVADAVGAPESITRSPEEVQARRQARQEAAAQQQQMEALVATSDAASKTRQ